MARMRCDVPHRHKHSASCRHDVSVRQHGPHTKTIMRHFLLCTAHQLHDLHTALRLDFPEGVADQLHKCIVSDASGHGVFDGNVQARSSSRNVRHTRACSMYTARVWALSAPMYAS